MVGDNPMDIRNLLNKEETALLPDVFGTTVQDIDVTLDRLIGSNSVDPSLTVPEHAPLQVAGMTPAQGFLHNRWKFEEEDLTELEKMMVPAAVRQGFRDGGALPIDPRSPLLGFKVSKFTTGLVSTSGWLPIDNDAWKKASEEFPADQDYSVASSLDDDAEDITGYNDLPGKLAKANAVRQPLMTKAELDMVLEDLSRSDETPLVDPKYFDLDSYMEHVESVEERQAKLNASIVFTQFEVQGDIEDAVLSEPLAEAGVSTTPPKTPEKPTKKTIEKPEAVIIDEDAAMLDIGVLSRADVATGGQFGDAALTVPNMSGLMSDPARRRSKSPPSLLKKIADASLDVHSENHTQDLSGDRKGKWELVDGDTELLRVGQPAPEKLTIRLRQKETGEIETHTFQQISPYFLDWNEKAHVQMISRWRSQVFRSRGFNLNKPMNFWLPAETSWLMLFHLKVKGVIEAGHLIRIPGPAYVVDAFNNFFEGKILQDSNGEDLPAREARDEVSIRGKLAYVKSGIKPMRDTMRKLLEGRPGGTVYVPEITEQELKKYLEDGTVLIDDDYDTGKHAPQSRFGSPKRKREVKDIGGFDEKRVKQ
tara:strand:+ start:846 stop:2621 length:1776 start_codon:yes stop_codon:yes gene_type:complete